MSKCELIARSWFVDISKHQGVIMDLIAFLAKTSPFVPLINRTLVYLAIFTIIQTNLTPKART